MTDLNDKINDVFEDIQEAHVKAGGSFRRRGELSKMTVGELIEVFVRNDVEMKFTYTGPKTKDVEEPTMDWEALARMDGLELDIDYMDEMEKIQGQF